MENQDRTGGDTAVVDPLKELAIKELVAEGFLPEEAKDFIALRSAAMSDLVIPDDCMRHLEALDDFLGSLTAPTPEMRVRVNMLEGFLLRTLRKLDEQEGDGIDFRAHARDLEAVDRAQPLHRKVVRALYYSAPVYFIRSRVLGHLF
ncbi:hypothetical protein KXS07_31455 [Inquilinus limosus]|uniref:hypothetical protein n=1 Tax=Inquilinus limosus TaxID=171674 RepID=UPI003F1398B8